MLLPILSESAMRLLVISFFARDVIGRIALDESRVVASCRISLQKCIWNDRVFFLEPAFSGIRPETFHLPNRDKECPECCCG